MPGKYDFPGLKKQGTRALNLVLLSTAWGAAILKSPFKPIFEMLEGYVIEWLTNKGLIIVNLGAIFIDGELDQKAFDKAFDDALAAAKVPGLTDKQKESIDAQVIAAFRNFAHVSSKPSK